MSNARPTPTIRPARVGDVHGIRELTDPLVAKRVLVPKETVAYFEAIQEFWVAEVDDELVGCGALHVMWEHLAEVRTLVTSPHVRGTGIGHQLLERLIDHARELGVSQVFCLTFEVRFFEKHGFRRALHSSTPDPGLFAELVRSRDEGVAEFLDLDRVKPNTLGNTRMLLDLENNSH